MIFACNLFYFRNTHGAAHVFLSHWSNNSYLTWTAYNHCKMKEVSFKIGIISLFLLLFLPHYREGHKCLRCAIVHINRWGWLTPETSSSHPDHISLLSGLWLSLDRPPRCIQVKRLSLFLSPRKPCPTQKSNFRLFFVTVQAEVMKID